MIVLHDKSANLAVFLEVDLLGGESASGAVSAPSDLLGAMDRQGVGGVASHSRLIRIHRDP